MNDQLSRNVAGLHPDKLDFLVFEPRTKSGLISCVWVCVCLAQRLDRRTECFPAPLSGDSCRTATQLTQLTTRTATCSFKRNYFGWWKEKNRLIQQQNLHPVTCCALKMQSGLQCVTHAAVGRLPVKNEGTDAKRKRETLFRSQQDFIKEIESEYLSKTSETSQYLQPCGWWNQ